VNIRLQYLGGGQPAPSSFTERDDQGPRKAAIKLVLAMRHRPPPRNCRILTCCAGSRPGAANGTVSSLAYLVMEFADENLAEVLTQRPLSATEARQALEPILDALEYLRARAWFTAACGPPTSWLWAINSNWPATGCALRVPGAPPRGTGPLRPARVSVRLDHAGRGYLVLGITLVEALTQHPPRGTAPEN